VISLNKIGTDCLNLCERLNTLLNASFLFRKVKGHSIFVMFSGSWDNSLLQYQNQFITQITNRLATVGHVSHIRVQNAQFRVESDQFYFVATLLDLPPPIGNLTFFYLHTEYR
jgi:hypothetical protein